MKNLLRELLKYGSSTTYQLAIGLDLSHNRVPYHKVLTIFFTCDCNTNLEVMVETRDDMHESQAT